MQNRRWIFPAALALTGALACATVAGAASFQPLVPVSAFAHPTLLDPSRLHFSTELSFGTGFGSGSQGLQVTRLTYNLGSPLAMQVSLGNAFGSGGMGSGFFLEGLDLAYHPSSSMLFEVRYQNLRSPLQLQSGRYDLWSPWR